jgi:hypothetical protein
MMTTFTLTDYVENKTIVEEQDGSLTANVVPMSCSVLVEPIPFMGLVQLQDKEDRELMLRDQLQILQAENQRLRKKLMEYGSND